MGGVSKTVENRRPRRAVRWGRFPPMPLSWPRHSLGLLMLLPCLALVVPFLLVPALMTVHLSTTNMSLATLGNTQFVGLDNYARLLERPELPRIAVNTVVFVVPNLVLFSLALPLAVAALTTVWNRSVGRFARLLWLLPRLTPSVVYSLLWVWLTADAPFGTLNQLAGVIGLQPRNWLLEHPWLTIVAADGLIGTSFATVLFVAAMEAVPRELVMAAQVDGASRWQLLLHVVLPYIRWPVLFVSAYQFLSLLASFELILLLTNGGPGLWQTETWSLYAYHQAFSYYAGGLQIGYGAAIATVLVLAGLVASLLFLRLFDFRRLAGEPRLKVA